MSYFIARKDVQGTAMPGHVSYRLLSEAHGCVAGFSSGITIYTGTEYPATGVHADQEGFVVMEGTGWARVGGEEHRLEPDVCFIAPAGVPHSIKRDAASPNLKVCWFHGAIT
jgi:mannose-6-phosphate isomerase-like protein (cupin superfamily)